jgi:carbon monoxide dehydrogenase subunit G/single-stranded DNA-binding protein
MEFEGEFTVDGSPDELWKYFTDPDILQDCAPGCEELTLVTPSRILATLSVGVGSINPSFDVEGVVVECDRPNRLELEACGEASRNSFEVTASQELEDNGDGTTTVRWKADAQVSGIIASMGERALGSVSDKLVNDFFEDLQDHVNAGTPAESKFEAASAEELDEAEQVPEVEAVADAADTDGGRSGPVDTLVERALGVGVGAAGGESEDTGGGVFYVLSGVILGVTGKRLWNRYRSTGDETCRAGEGDVTGVTGGSSFSVQLSIDRDANGEDVGETEAVGEESGRSARSVLSAVLVGVVGKLLWDRYRRTDDVKADVAEQSVVDERDETDEQESAEQEVVEQKSVEQEAVEQEPEEENASEGKDEPDENDVDTDDSDDPLDRLSSR